MSITNKDLENTCEHLILHIKSIMGLNKVTFKVEDLITDESDHINLYRYLLFDFSEVVSSMVKRYIIIIDEMNEKQEDQIQDTINEYRFGRGQDFKELDDCKLRALVYKIGFVEFNITSGIDETEFIECFINTQDLIGFTIDFITYIVKYHNVSSFCDSVGSTTSSNYTTATASFNTC